LDRSIVYTQEQGRSTDFLFAQRSAMIGLSKLSEALFGTSTLSSGLGVIPTSPASLSVYVNPGQIYALEDVDATAYGVLAADTTHQILKQGVLLDQATLTMTAPTTSGYSINYLIQAAFTESDTNNVVLPYFNSANPSQPLSGQSNSGAPQATERQDLVTLVAKAGTAAATGTQTTPSPDSGYIGLAVVTIAYGQTTITSSNISVYSGAPVVPAGGAFASSRSSILDLAVGGNTDVILDAEGQAPYPIINMTGAVTGNANLIVPTGSTGRWIVLNNTTGSFTRTVKTSAGTGILVPQGTSMLVYCDGTNVYNATSSALSQTAADALFATIANGVQPGTILPFGGATPPAGYLAIPTASTNISRTTYAALFAAIGTTWGAGDGSTTFGLPFVAANGTLLQSSANLGANTTGQVISHAHNIYGNFSTGGLVGIGAACSAQTVDGGVVLATGGSQNIAAGSYVNFVIKY